MSVRSLLLIASFALVSQAAPSFLLDSDYREWSVPNLTRMLTDKDGFIYLLSSFPISGNTPPSTVTKLTADGKAIVWQNRLDIAVTAIAVDPNGGVFVTPLVLGGPLSVSKLDATGSGLAWTKPTGITGTFGFTPSLAADSSGRVYITAFEGAARAVRLTADGNTQEYSRSFPGMPTSIVVDASGSAIITGYSDAGIFLTRLAPDGTPLFLSSVAHPSVAPSVAVDTSGNAIVYSGGVLKRFDSTGTLLSSKTVAAWERSYPGVVLDTAGNAYIAGSSVGTSHPVKNTLATCQSELLSVIAADDTVLQTTYLADALNGGTVLPVAIGANSAVLVAPLADSTFVPDRDGPLGPSSGASFLMQLSQHAAAHTLPLSCATNALSFRKGAIAPGEMLTLFGDGLGPETGIAGTATLQSPFPVKLGEVQATVNGNPAALLWAQDRQINLIVPWGTAVGSNAEVCVLNAGVRTNCLMLPSAETAPGVATTDGFHAAAMNQDGTLNSPTNPAPAESIVAIWVTGLGPIAPAQADGAIVAPPLPSNRLFSLIEFSTPNIFPGGGGTVSFPEMTYLGPAPLMVSGVTQINFRKPSRAGSYRVKVGSNSGADFAIY